MRAQIFYRYDISGYYSDRAKTRTGDWRVRPLQAEAFARVGELELGLLQVAPEGADPGRREDGLAEAAERCFALLNHDERPRGFEKQRSMSCGDIALIDGAVLHCVSAGFDWLRHAGALRAGLEALPLTPGPEFFTRSEQVMREAREREIDPGPAL
jgi:hypothetical protein